MFVDFCILIKNNKSSYKLYYYNYNYCYLRIVIIIMYLCVYEHIKVCNNNKNRTFILLQTNIYYTYKKGLIYKYINTQCNMC